MLTKGNLMERKRKKISKYIALEEVLERQGDEAVGEICIVGDVNLESGHFLLVTALG